MKHQVEHLNKIGVAATAIDIEEEAGKNGRVPRLCLNTVRVITLYICCVLFLVH